MTDETKETTKLFNDDEEPKNVTKKAAKEIEKEATRRTRKPLHRRRALVFDERPGFVRRVVNDVNDGDRVRMFKEAGWNVVKQEDIKGPDEMAYSDHQIGSAVMRSVGGGVKGVLMEIPKEFYDEDQAEKIAKLRRREKNISRVNAGSEDSGAFYGEVKISVGDE